MVDFIVLGEEENAICFQRYAKQQNKKVHFLSVTNAQIMQAENNFTTDIAEELKTLNTNEADIISFADDLQILTDVLRKDMSLSQRNLPTLKMLSDKARSRLHDGLAPFFAQSISVELSTNHDILVETVSAALSFPVVVKPSNAFYSAGVTRCDNPSALKKAFVEAKAVARAMRTRRGESSIVIEEYIAGDEYAVDGAVHNGVVYPLQLHKKYPHLSGPKFHEHAMISQHLLNDDLSLSPFRDYATRVIEASGLDQSVFHMEFRSNAEGAFVLLEVAPRVAGGGTSGWASFNITSGLDFFAILNDLNTGNFDARSLIPMNNKISLEFDFGSEANGTLCNISDLLSECRTRGACDFYQFKNDGDYIRKEGDGLESCLLVYFSCDTVSIAEEMFNELYGVLKVKVN